MSLTCKTTRYVVAEFSSKGVCRTMVTIVHIITRTYIIEEDTCFQPINLLLGHEAKQARRNPTSRRLHANHPGAHAQLPFASFSPPQCNPISQKRIVRSAC